MELEAELILKNINTKILSNLSKSDLARSLGIKPQSLNTILHTLEKSKDCKISTIKKIAKAANLDYRELLE